MHTTSGRSRFLVAPLLVVTGALAAGDASLYGEGRVWDELGRVSWGRDLDAALSTSESTGRPAFLLFQEVPGCKTCSDFGLQVLSQPLLVEAIETLFVPVLVYNNRSGLDAQLLKKFREPSWNNPVVRYLRGDGSDLLPRRTRVWSPGETASRMIEALRAAKRPVPGYLQLFAQETRNLDTATFAMHCYWDGEARLGQLDGVLRSRAGWVGFDEVVTVEYDPATIAFTDLLRRARKARAARRVYTRGKRQREEAGAAGVLDSAPLETEPRLAKEGDRKFALRRSRWRHLPLTPAQATKMNAALRLREDPTSWLSPRQLELVKRIDRYLAARSDPDALSDWMAPEELAELPAYEDRLRRHLEGKPSVEAVPSGRRRFP